MKRVYNFLKLRWVMMGLSAAIFIVCLVAIIMEGGFNMGIDFVGGVKVTVGFEKGIDSNKIRNVFSENKINASVQTIGEENNEYIISTKLLAKGEAAEESYNIIKNILDKNFKGYRLLGIETVGPAIGKYLMNSALYSFIIVIILMLIYLWFRFEIKYAVGGLVALFHDVILSAMVCGALRIEMNIPVVAALLTIFGYSINDTIVIFDRIRENVKVQSKNTFIEIINRSISEMLSRTILTSALTLFSVLALFFIAGDALRSFLFVMLYGIIIGSYSTIYIASPIVLIWEKLWKK